MTPPSRSPASPEIGPTPGTVVIIGAGPAGLTAARELLLRGGPRTVVLEQGTQVGGLSRTVVHAGNRIDIGGHRFFSKSERVNELWRSMLPVEGDIDPRTTDRVMLLRDRLSRILFLGSLFDYPISPTFATLSRLGLLRTARILASYVRRRLLPVRPEASLEDFFVNRFGDELYRTFFRDYTEKVWGVPCREIRPEWGAQRVKGLSIAKAAAHAIRTLFGWKPAGVETSLIDRFQYPKFGPGQMWDAFADDITARGGEILTGVQVTGIRLEGDRVSSVVARNVSTGEETVIGADHVVSTMPVRDLVAALDPPAPPAVREVAAGLRYRDFLTVGLLVRKLPLPVPDQWIYIQEPEVRLGRLQIFNNWSPYLVATEGTVWLGLEYFCAEGDDLWSRPDDAMKASAAAELRRIGFLDDGEDVLDAVVIREKKAYPAYFGSYDRFDVVRGFVDGISNLYLVGRNGMHRYNNQDHSMLSAMEAVSVLLSGERSRERIWSVNAEDDYHEEKAPARS